MENLLVGLVEDRRSQWGTRGYEPIRDGLVEELPLENLLVGPVEDRRSQRSREGLASCSMMLASFLGFSIFDVRIDSSQPPFYSDLA